MMYYIAMENFIFNLLQYWLDLNLVLVIFSSQLYYAFIFKFFFQ
jgi:hypothetical protein